jgi:ABC-type bacteriocin/lantibiotic exporter with double-glycine peptidase domain
MLFQLSNMSFLFLYYASEKIITKTLKKFLVFFVFIAHFFKDKQTTISLKFRYRQSQQYGIQNKDLEISKKETLHIQPRFS